MVVLSDKEKKLISKYRQEPRPEFYSAQTRTNLSISPDLEAFIILMPNGARQDVVNWVHQNTKTTSRNSTRDELLSECLNMEGQDADRKIEELDKALANYDRFHASYFKSVFPENETPTGTNDSQLLPKQQRFGNVPEVGQIIQDLKNSVEEALSLRDRMKHLKVLTAVLDNRRTQTQLSDEQKKQVSSWAAPFSAYSNDKT